MDEADVSVQAVTHKVLKTKLPPLKIFYHDLMIMLRIGEESSSSSKRKCIGSL